MVRLKNFIIIANKNRDTNYEIASSIIEYIKKAGGNAVFYEASYYERILTSLKINEDLVKIINGKKIECAIVLGGDGTIIHAANELLTFDIPVLGVNLGTLGFLAEVEEHNLFNGLDKILKNDYSYDNRMMIEGRITKGDNKIILHSLNDIVITRKGFSRIISLSVYVNDNLVDNFRGDGIIVSTPTGSTGYNLSAGGPVAPPNEGLMIITPICAHSLSAKSIIVSKNDEIKVVVGKSKKTQEVEAIVTFDGDKVIELDIEDEVIIKKASYTTKLIKINNTSFYDVLRTKLNHNN